jgi:outer membrane immunogenic protein
MKWHLTWAVASAVSLGVGTLGAASAADMAVKAPPLAPVYNWTGFYVGGNAGWVGSTSNSITNTGTDAGTAGLGSALNIVGSIPPSVSASASGFIGGGQIGYNWQAANWVFGLEGDIQGTTAKGNVTAAFPGSALSVPLSTTYHRELDWLATFRGRVGIAATPSFLLYATGGLAVGETKIGNSFICTTCAPPASTQAGTVAQSDNTSVGWTVGAGAEWMFAPQWSVKAEYLYVDLGRHSSTINYIYGPGGALTTASSLTSSVRDTWNIARVGVNYRFGGPVMARY